MLKEQNKKLKGEHEPLSSKSTSPGGTSKKRHAFLVANTYENGSLPALPGTTNSTEKIKDALFKHGFQSSMHINKDFEKMAKELAAWKEKAIQDVDLDALLVYFCGHGGRNIKSRKYHINHII